MNLRYLNSRFSDVFFESVEEWIHVLYDSISDIKSQGKKVVLVAISRKMPRLLQSLFYSNNIDHDSLALLHSIMEENEYITEHALPFVYSSDSVGIETIIIDDTAVFGNTIRVVAKDIVELSGKKPFILPIFTSEEAFFGRNVRTQLLNKYPILPLPIIQEFHKLVDTLVKEKALPIDVEFPIFRYNCSTLLSPGNCYDYLDKICQTYLSDEINDKYGTEKSRLINGYSNRLQSFSLILKKPMGWMSMTSFSKIRFFYNGFNLCIASFSPQVLNDSKLIKKNLFQNRMYNRIWEAILSALNIDDAIEGDSRLHERVAHSLVVWANYLLSLSRLNSVFTDLSFDTGAFSAILDDVKLLAGKRLGKSIIDDINHIFYKKEVTAPLYGKAELPDISVPASLSASYKAIRSGCWSQGLGKSVGYTLDNLFDTMEYSKGTLSRSMSFSEQMFSGVYESHESLLDLLEMRPYDENVLVDLNRWIDHKVDEGKLVPSYQPVQTKSGQRWWKRFFSNSRSSIEL